MRFDTAAPPPRRVPAIVCDIDGTLTEQADYTPGKVTPNQPVISLVKSFAAKGYAVILLTGRPDSARRVTLTWLRALRIPFVKLIMRRPDQEALTPFTYKLGAFRSQIEPFFEVAASIDNRAGPWHYLGVAAPSIHRIRSLGAGAYRWLA